MTTILPLTRPWRVGCTFGRLMLPCVLVSGLATGSLLGQQTAKPQTKAGVENAERQVEKAEKTVLAPAMLPGGGRAQVFEGPEEESSDPFELSVDPSPSTADLSGTQAIPDYLKGDPYRLAFWGGDYAPPKSQRVDPRLAAALRTKAKSYGFVMFEGRITEAKMRRVIALGVELDVFHTFQSYTATISAAALPRLAKSPDVRWVGYAQPRQKVDPRVFAKVAQLGPQAVQSLHVTVFASDMTFAASKKLVASATLNSPSSEEEAKPSDHAWATLPNGPFQKRLEALGAKITSYTDGLKTFHLDAKLGDALRMAGEDFVHFVELKDDQKPHHDRSTRQIGVDAIRGSSLSDGRGAIVGILDSGFHIRGSANPTGHRDLVKWAVGWNFTKDAGNVFVDTDGHGTHVAGTAIGTGTANNRFRGCAPGAGPDATHRVFFGKVFGKDGTYLIPGIQKFRLSAATTIAPHVVNYSGGGTPSSLGWYGTETAAREVDYSVHRYNQIYVISAGNSGARISDHIGGHGVTKQRSCGNPAASKNAMAVANQYPTRATPGASYNLNVLPKSKGGPFPANITNARGRSYAIGIYQGSYFHTMPVRGFKLRARAYSTRTIKTYLYLRNSTTGLPNTTPIRVGTMTIGTKEDYYETKFSQPFSIATGQRYYVGFDAPSDTTTVGPWTSNSKAASIVCHYKSRGGWSNIVLKPIVQLTFDVDTGEVNSSSSQGPTRDGRLKPNITAPGTWISSCLTGTQDKYKGGTGTSMSAPHVTGCFADMLHRDSVHRRRPAMAKAMVAASANMFGQTATFDYRSRSSYYRQGFGQFDAYRSIYQRNSSSGWQSGRWYGTFTSSSSGAYVDWTVPSDADRLMVALNFDERAASSGAKRACLADLDLYIDVYPFSSGYNTGEYSSRRAWDTWDWLAFTSSISKLRGKRIRIKIFPRVRPGFGTTADFGIGLNIQRGDPAPNGTLVLSAPTAVKPGQEFTVTATPTVPSMQLTNTFLEIRPDSVFSVRGLSFRTPDNLLRAFNGNVRSRTLGYVGYWYSTLHKRFYWRLLTNSTGKRNICATMRSDNFVTRGSSTKAITRCTSICVDNTTPAITGSLTSTTHTVNQWSNKSTLLLKWNAAYDRGCAGVQGLGYRHTLNLASSPTSLNLGSTVTSLSRAVTSSTYRQYLSLRPMDKAGNWGSTRIFGPFYVDLTRPGIRGLSLDGGATYTKDLTVSLSTSASDSYSGVSSIRYTNGRAWSPWQAYSSKFDIDLSSYGGNSNEGLKTVLVQVRDKAGNISSTVSTRITYDKTPPAIQIVRINNGAKLTSSLLVNVEAPATGGARNLRYSWNDKTWSPWFAYSASARRIDLRAYGGSSRGGDRTMHVQARDAAGNVSPSKTATIAYWPVPRIKTLAPSTLLVLDERAVLVDGGPFDGVSSVMLDTLTLGSKPDPLKGWFEVLSSTRIRLHAPQALAPKAYTLRVKNPGYASNAASLTIAHNTTPTLWSTPTVKTPGLIDVLVHRGQMPTNTLTLLTLSVSPHPLVLPGLIKLEHGGNPTTFIDPSFFVVPGVQVHDGNRLARWKIPALAKVKVYFEAAHIDPAKIGQELATSNRDVTSIQ